MWIGLLVAGLWPFNFYPDNTVKRIVSGGLHFGMHGQVYSLVPWRTTPVEPSAAPARSFSIEIELQADKVCPCVGTILSFHDPYREKDFRIEQSISDLVVRGYFQDEHHAASFRSLWLDESLSAHQTRFLTVTSGPEGTSLYLEGGRVRTYPFTPAADNLSGRLLLGHSAEARGDWPGSVFGVAVYSRKLTADEVLQHYRLWKASAGRELQSESGISGLYRFDESDGGVIHNRAGSMPDLVIPARFSVLKRRFLTHGLNPRRANPWDLVINVAGFIPFGLLISWYATRAGLSTGQAIMVAVIAGGSTSLLIECLQAYLPSRDSSLLDLISNMLGAALGAMILKMREICFS